MKIDVLTQLETQLYRKGDVIIDRMDQVTDMILISQGTCNLYGFIK